MKNMLAMKISAISVFSIFLLISLSPQTVLAQDAAGRVVFAQGSPRAIDSAGSERGLSRSTEVFSGDRIVTNNGRVQLSMVDGAFISVQPNSEYSIDNYTYSGSPDGSENASYRLVKGGVRAVTGLIGRQNPEAYKVNTAVATIGIRGTGHNTRICAGDCGSRQDGLYHSTWEGVTFVVNDVDVVEVPTGTGVFVQDIDADIEILDQPPAVLAVETRRKKQQQEQEDSEEQAQIVSSGDQRDASGDQVIVSTGTRSVAATVLNDIGVLGIAPDEESQGVVENFFSFDFGTNLFLRDTDNAAVGFFGLEDDDDGTQNLTMATIDAAAIRGGDDATRFSVAQQLLNAADPALLASLLEDPATAAESFYNGEVGFGRWTDGRVLVLHEVNDLDNPNEIFELTGFQSVHYLFGTAPPTLPTSGMALYNFIDGTRSTSFSGETIGAGATDGNISVFFGDAYAFLNLDVTHNSQDYYISGSLDIDNEGSLIGSSLGLRASGGLCDPDCNSFIDAGFAGPGTNGFPKHIALAYGIQVADAITGVAAFGYEAPQAPTLTTTVQTNSIFIAVSPDLAEPDQVYIVEAYNASLFIHDSNLYGALFTEEDQDIQTTFRVVATVNPDRVLGGDNTASVTEADAILSAADTATVNAFKASTPAAIEDSFFNSTSGFGWGRWTGGHVLSSDSTGTDDEVLTGTQSIHYIYGEDPGVIASTGFANYALAGGTSSTSTSGATVGNGAASGSIFVDFSAGGSSSINMVVDHIIGFPYTISGPLSVDAQNNSISDIGTTASTSAVGSACNSMCNVFIDGGFAGPTSPAGIPGHIGIEYDIQDTDVVTGVAGFSQVASPSSL